MKYRYLVMVIAALALLSIMDVSAYQNVCFENGEDMVYPGVECQSECCVVCVNDNNYPALPQSCMGLDDCSCDGIIGNAFGCTETWECSDWGPCMPDDTQTRTCLDVNACGTETYRPSTSQVCDYDDPVADDLLMRIEALEEDVSTLQTLLESLQQLVDSILARVEALELGGEPPEGCAYDNPACDPGYECQDNVCVELVGCAYDNPVCDPGFTCVENTCVEEPPVGCAYDNPACDPGYECQDNVCVELVGCAYDNPTCDPGYECQDNVCVELAGCAYDNPACSEGMQCVDNVCIVPEQQVIFRTNVPSARYWSSDGEIVFDYDGDGDLDCLEYYSYYRYYQNRQPEILAETMEGYEVHKYQTDKAIIQYRDNYIYRLADSCTTPLTTVPTEPYATNNQEVYS